MEINAETYTHYLNAKNRTHLNKSPRKAGANKALKAALRPVSELLRHEIWAQSMRQVHTQLLSQGNVSVPHLGVFWIAKQETNLPGIHAKSTTYAVHFLIEEFVAPQMFKMKQPILGKSIPQEPEGLDTRRIALDLGSVSKERVRQFFREFARQLAKEIRKMNVSAQLSVPFADMGKAVFTATNYGVRWEKNFVKNVKDSIRRLRDDQPQNDAEGDTAPVANGNATQKIESAPSVVNTKHQPQMESPQREPCLPPLVRPKKVDNQKISPKQAKGEPTSSPEIPLRSRLSPKQNGSSPLNKSSFSPNSALSKGAFSFPSERENEDNEDDSQQTRQKKARMQSEWKRQIRERELAAEREAEADRKLREMNEYVAELFSESEKKKFVERRSREMRTMNDNLQIAQMIKNIRERTDDIPECGDIFQKRRSDHPVFSKEQLKVDLRQQMIEKQERLLAEKKQSLTEERKEFLKLQKSNMHHRNEAHQNDLRKKEYQKILLQKQMEEKTRQTHAMFDDERRREMAEQVLVPGHDDEIASNSKKIAKELQRQALEDAARKHMTQKQFDSESKTIEKAMVDYARLQDQQLKQKAKEKTKATQKEMKRFWDNQLGVAQWKNPVMEG
uniref:Uncharacterized protein n=1 Tax=Percolomonas cosmopolitus TaxID=63605 RepID=A0A7S1KUK4_9EUKA|mmetsp:Transcript_9147/g.33759  ORF Transcript_9147/g.33759 Transcript_9147/m.33759 type:complete len:617 (+) Transcript_9147:155-2005(+)|eukprot:CAMPEP_0117439024 /NCGR_PEP_ID=MMETSP0759-20121206/2356_1 /TAXON_ID=63605 /ORGANISM="Percolomonas cosmopolitus, Strain WS" /LENGTH=616 /DNA_ID=CAMNT_0005230735 /DNA_START=131 /DNA_END=1981 /DNA_ORIENTATION=+